MMNDTNSIITIVVHAIVLVLMLIITASNTSLLNNNTWDAILYIAIVSLFGHTSFLAGKSNPSKG